MLKTKKEIQANITSVDAIIEIRDARIPRSSANPDIDELCKDKPRLILLNKYDLADDKMTDKWCRYLKKNNVSAIPVNCVSGKGINNIKPTIHEILKEKYDRMAKKGIQNYRARIMVVGIPNVGKSSFINKMAKNNIAKTGDRPGVTKNKQWIKTSLGMDLMDTPGVLWPRFDNEEVALNLAFTGAIKNEIMDLEELSFKLIDRLKDYYPENLMERYKLTEISEDSLEVLDAIGRKRGMVLSGNRIDYNRLSTTIIDEYRGGKMGRLTLEKPDEDKVNLTKDGE
jgi:ribosome biogenesis GTPase A